MQSGSELEYDLQSASVLHVLGDLASTKKSAKVLY